MLFDYFPKEDMEKFKLLANRYTSRYENYSFPELRMWTHVPAKERHLQMQEIRARLSEAVPIKFYDKEIQRTECKKRAEKQVDALRWYGSLTDVISERELQGYYEELEKNKPNLKNMYPEPEQNAR